MKDYWGLAGAALAVGFAVGVLIHTWILTTIP